MFQFKILILGGIKKTKKQFKLKEMPHPVYLHLNCPNICSIRSLK